MKSIVKIISKSTSAIISENEFDSKKEAMKFIKTMPKDSDVVIFGNYKNSGKNFYTAY